MTSLRDDLCVFLLSFEPFVILVFGTSVLLLMCILVLSPVSLVNSEWGSYGGEVIGDLGQGDWGAMRMALERGVNSKVVK